MKNNYKYMVCTRCATYNHALYIEDALRGFAMQETSFPVVFVIIDDASIDGEQDVLRKWASKKLVREDGPLLWKEMHYGQLMVGQLKEKLNFTFVILLLAENHYQKGIGRKKLEYITEWNDNAKYIALCEGDDYWIDPQKLQNQVLALNNNEHVTMVYTDFLTIDENGNTIIRPKYEEYKKLYKSGDNLPNLLKTNYPLTCTVMIRKEVYFSEIYINAPNKFDYSLFVAAAFMGDFVYLDNKSSCYRMNPNSLMNSSYSIIVDLYTNATDYYAYAYSRGLSKKERFINDFIIKYRISKKYVSQNPEHKQMFRAICRSNKSFYWFVLIVWVVKIFEKITFQR